MSGNPHGLSELSHFGSMQRVGGKAAGFINKKFFHPSSLRNQEKLWQAQTADERAKKKEKEMAQRREEELQVENLRKQMYLSGQGKASDLKTSGASTGAASTPGGGKGEKWEAAEEQKRRMQLLKKERAAAAAAAANEDGERTVPADQGQGERKLAKSTLWTEDVLINGHGHVWGSWYDTLQKRWGFACCKGLNRDHTCPLEPEEDVPEDERAKASKRARKRARDGEEAGGEPANEQQGGLAAAPPSEKKSSAPLIDPKFVEAALRRKEQKRVEEEQRKRAKINESSYLGNLLEDASSKEAGAKKEGAASNK